ncbi:methyltransferase domain-containing protein [Roseateles asaccharophilus]|uniref:Ubiquinone/menaquinone biosynthesis C-methylase UbiE n=1 Tax=Roseateles asaccharophilus TaxID=582607 RepID=A0ABU2A6J5_9BURK|nr:methyltransferase domain-containing protein [Roseateles asaccharophilus]MDR7332799.1 ubiquinone/menaquinone biosynthesis C-methylase UbiE [Roseateles asaccharophilus]
MTSASAPSSQKLAFVPETRFGLWFLSTPTWRVHVLGRALADLQRLAPDAPRGGVMLDIGTGQGHSLPEMATRFAPAQIHALDPEPDFEARVGAMAKACPVPVTLHAAHAESIPLPDASVDIVLCHQTLHHIVDQSAALAEVFRVLKPGGMLLLAESTRAYIHSWVIRLLFRHPMHVQRSAEEFLALIRDAGFHVDADRISTPYLWWSRSDLGAREWLGFGLPKNREETLLNVVARKPG